MDRDPPSFTGILAAKPNGYSNGVSYSNGRVSRNATQPSTYRRVYNNTSKLDSKENNIPSDNENSTGSSGSRHPLYTGPKYIPNRFSPSPRKNSESPRETRIPRPMSASPFSTSPNPRDKQGNTQGQSLDMRQPMSLRSAFALAKKQEVDDQVDDDTFSIRHAFNIASAEMDGRIDGSPSPAPRKFQQKRQSYGAIPRRTSGPSPTSAPSPSTDLGHHLQRFDRNHQLGTGSRPLSGLFGKNQVGSTISEAGNGLAKKVSDNNLRGSPARRGENRWDARLGREGRANAPVSVPSFEYESASDGQASPIDELPPRSPEKSFNWHLDADFTAEDLQVSDSPRIRAGQSNGRLTGQFPSATSSPVRSTPNMRRSNNRIDQIRQKELEVANAVLPEEDMSATTRTNSRLDELRAREREALSKRAMATSRLEEIRIKNSEARSESPETERKSYRDDLHKSPEKSRDVKKALDGNLRSETKEDQGPKTTTTVTTFQNTNSQKPCEPLKEKASEIKVENEIKGSQLRRNDSQDLLRRLARAASSSPSPEKNEQTVIPYNSPTKTHSDNRENSRPRSIREEKGSMNLEAKNSRERPTVGFTGLRRDLSVDSIREKRTSRSGSEVDPTDRIEAEMKLFAPLDNYSEKGSVRAPSPTPPEPTDELTPRPTKIDPLTQPTPRVTGAYVETPATVRVKQEERLESKRVLGEPNRTSNADSEARARSSSDPSNIGHTKSEDDTEASKNASMPRSSSVPAGSRRARSASRRRRPRRPLINTAKPPSVKDDIRAILRMNQIDDSTLEDFDTILADQEIDEKELEKMINDTKNKVDNDLEIPGLSERDRELQAYDRMSKSLKTGLLGIRSAKKGIERLEDKVMHTEHKPDPTQTGSTVSVTKSETNIPTPQATSVVLPIPALYRRSPKFRLTKFGVLAFLVFIWYIVESIFCSLYTPHYNCTPEVPCDWSPNEPYFPYAIPFMLDEWATGGKGRALTWRFGEEVGDIVADISDWITNTDFTQFDEKFMNVWERKRHRRRLRKHGLIPKWVAPPDYIPKFAGWNAARLAREAAEEDDDGGYGFEDEIMSADERIS
ncbi:uncharacterized protein F4812DRAFT_419475 [Daldinia caldariorum]|uniref:uncharacterized protein n=1 Tax=Daldinia caldariorum TaxID=326644 RepID=UPI002007AF50|nr:uncharacterized protein F4812DRAFT_419475 [Daldinia caldariorum]KAI1470923.1 hypothetical protein F4812DRAFT_419475 [Daldinia caldariorum]